MAIGKVKEYFRALGMEDKVLEFDVSSATVALAAQALGCDPAHIAKSMAFTRKEGGCTLVVAAGDVKIDNRKFKDTFGEKAKMLSPEETLELVGHAVGGVCPFAVNDGVQTYLDVSLKRFETVYPACGSSNSAIALSCDALEQYANAIGWVDVCKLSQTENT